MAGIPRITQVVFGSTGLTGTGGFGAAAGGTVTTEQANANTLSNLMSTSAWPAGWLNATLGSTKFPAIEDMNAVDYTLSTQIAYLLERGIPEYDVGTTYNANDICRAIGGLNLYASVGNANVGNAVSNASFWTSLGSLGNLGGSISEQAITGASHTLASTDSTFFTKRSNAGSAMTDSLPTGGSALVNGNYGYYQNVDATASIVVSGGTINQGNLTGNVIILPGELWMWQSQGTAVYNWQRIASAVLHAAPPQGTRKNLKIITTSNTAATITADEVVVEDTNGNTRKLKTVNVSYATGTAGANGLDTGSVAASNWYNEFVIFNPTTNTVASLISLSATAPTLPTGYTMFARVGASRVDASVHLLFKIQYNARAQYAIGSNPTQLPTIASGSSGTPGSSGGGTATAWSAFAPATASRIEFVLTAGGATQCWIAPNSAYGPVATNPPVSVNTSAQSASGELTLESANIYYASNGSSTAYVLGWEDNL